MEKLNFFEKIPPISKNEILEDLLANNKFRLERILSFGNSTPEGEWLSQPWDEWVILLKGNAVLSFENSPERTVMEEGDYLLIPAYQRHRVEFTNNMQVSVWLAIHFSDD